MLAFAGMLLLCKSGQGVPATRLPSRILRSGFIATFHPAVQVGSRRLKRISVSLATAGAVVRGGRRVCKAGVARQLRTIETPCANAWLRDGATRSSAGRHHATEYTMNRLSFVHPEGIQRAENGLARHAAMAAVRAARPPQRRSRTRKRPGDYPGPSDWWRWRELNPRPKAFDARYYMLSSPLDLVCRQHGVRSAPADQPVSFSQAPTGRGSRRSCDSDPTSTSTGTSGFGARP